jgi:hypothetical protein
LCSGSVGGPAAIQADHAWERQLVLDRRAKFAMALKVRSPPTAEIQRGSVGSIRIQRPAEIRPMVGALGLAEAVIQTPGV